VSKPDFNSQELQLLLRQFERGNVVLFAGAGFSIGATNTLGEDPPLVPDLCRALASDCGWTYDNEELAVVFAQAQKYRELPVSLRNGAVRFANRSESGSVSHVFREEGIHIVADTVAEVVADDAYSIQPGD